MPENNDKIFKPGGAILTSLLALQGCAPQYPSPGTPYSGQSQTMTSASPLQSVTDEEVGKLLNDKTKLDTLARTVVLESGAGANTVNADNPNVAGIYQFNPSTGALMGLDPVDRNNEYLSLLAAARLYDANKQGLSISLGRTAKEFEISYAHQQGVDGASALIRNPNSNAIDVLRRMGHPAPQDAINNNSGTDGMSAKKHLDNFRVVFNNADANLGLAKIQQILKDNGKLALLSDDLQLHLATASEGVILPINTDAYSTSYRAILDRTFGPDCQTPPKLVTWVLRGNRGLAEDAKRDAECPGQSR